MEQLEEAAAPQPEEEEDAYLHYCQHQLSPRSRSDYDAFNRVHFERLQTAQGKAAKRAVTPKVGIRALKCPTACLCRGQALGHTRALRPLFNCGSPAPWFLWRILALLVGDYPWGRPEPCALSSRVPAAPPCRWARSP